jgi:hypothetical protein
MKRSFVKTASFAAIAASVLALGGSAFAGLRDLRQVTAVRYSDGRAYGNGTVSGARLSADVTQWIGCSNYTFTTGTGEYASCSAKNSAGVFVNCAINSSQPGFWAIRDAIAMLSTNSDLTFSSDATGRCTSVSVQNFSYSIP